MSKKRRHKPKPKLRVPDPEQIRASSGDQAASQAPLPAQLTQGQIREVYRKGRQRRGGPENFWSYQRVFTIATLGVILLLLIIGIMIISGSIKISRDLRDSTQEIGYDIQQGAEEFREFLLPGDIMVRDEE